MRTRSQAGCPARLSTWGGGQYVQNINPVGRDRGGQRQRTNQPGVSRGVTLAAGQCERQDRRRGNRACRPVQAPSGPLVSSSGCLQPLPAWRTANTPEADWPCPLALVNPSEATVPCQLFLPWSGCCSVACVSSTVWGGEGKHGQQGRRLEE